MNFYNLGDIVVMLICSEKYYFRVDYAEQYKNLRQKYKPKDIKLLLVAESPPYFYPKLKFFYNEEKIGKENLFEAVMQGIFPDFDKKVFRKVKNKRYWLKRLLQEGVYLFDVFEFPVNKDINGNKVPISFRKKLVIQNIISVCYEIDKLLKKRKEIPIVLISSPVHILENRLRDLCYKNIIKLPFPIYNYREKFICGLCNIKTNSIGYNNCKG